MVNPIYSKTQFKTKVFTTEWPNSFAIITAYATTGETWSASKNILANQSLEALFDSMGVWYEPITGYDPETEHEEPGFAVELDWKTSCDIGLEFKQDAIFFVKNDGIVYISYCDDRRDLVFFDIFGQRLHQAPLSSDLPLKLVLNESLTSTKSVEGAALTFIEGIPPIKCFLTEDNQAVGLEMDLSGVCGFYQEQRYFNDFVLEVVEYRLNDGQVSIDESVDFGMLFESGFCVTVEANSSGVPLVISIINRTKEISKRLIKQEQA